ncbi:MAG: helix-turn-helix transcriptional regulator [Clostridia bacterium]|nr:helix-turn-helix transcriptional regulator [Clostridia bacterium]
MNNIFFYKTFSFKSYAFKKYRHTDNAKGIAAHYVGQMIHGKARIVSDTREELVLLPGDYFYLPKNMRYHSYWYGDPQQDDRIEWSSFSFEYFPSENDKRYRAQKLFPTEEAEEAFKKLAASRTVSAGSVGQLYVFLGAVLETMEPAERAVSDALVTRARAYISEHPNFKVPELAKHCGISESGLYAFFKSHMDMTPICLKNRMKAEQATVLLESTGMSVEEISTRLGFSTSAYFRKVIKEQTGKTPLQIRKEAKFI